MHGKMAFDGNYLAWYNILKDQEKVSVFNLEEYLPVSSAIRSLQWEGEGKESICTTIEQIDAQCSTYYQTITCFVNKTKIAYTVLYPELKLLKEKIDMYNHSIDNYERIRMELEAAKAREDSINNEVI